MKKRNKIYTFLPLIGIIIPFIIYLFTYSPVLTQNMCDELAYAKYLSSHGAHYFADGWISTKVFFPFSIRFFATMFIQKMAWDKVLLFSVCCCYLISSILMGIFVVLLNIKKLIPAIISTVIISIANVLSLFSTYGCSNIMSYISFVMLIAILVLCGIKYSSKKYIKLILLASPIIPIAALVIFEVNCITHNNKVTPSNQNILTSFSIDFNWKSKNNLDKKLSSTAIYLSDNSIKNIYSLESVKNYFYLITDNKIISREISLDNNLNMLDTFSEENTNISTPLENDYLLIATNEAANESILDKLTFSCLEYADEYYSVYSLRSIEFFKNTEKREELKNILTNEYDSVVISMYDNGYTSDMYDTMRAFSGWNFVYTTCEIITANELSAYSDVTFSSGNQINDCVLKIDPMSIFAECQYASNLYENYISSTLLKYISENASTTFHIEFPAYAYSHYAEYSDEDYLNMDKAYSELLYTLCGAPNVHYHYFNEDWIYDNKYIFQNNSDIKYEESVASEIMLLNVPDERFYTQDIEMIIESIHSLKDEINHSPLNSINGNANIQKDGCLVILGDSIFGNYTNNSSIQAIIQNYSNYEVICEAIGGSFAKSNDGIDNIFGGQLSSLDSLDEKIKDFGFSDSETTFIVEFGLNDYLNVAPLRNDDKSDVSTYEGALYTGIDIIENKWPNATIIVCAPGYTTFYENGTSLSANPNIINEYRLSAKQVSLDNNTEFISFADDISITQDTFTKYSFDGVHYNMAGRMLIAKYLINYLSKS